MLSEQQIKDRIYELKKEIEILISVLNGGNTKKDYIFGRPKGSIKYSQEQVDFLKECVKNKLDDKEIIKLFNIKFKTNFKENSRRLYNFMTRYGIKTIGYSPKRFNEDEDKFILENIGKLNKQKIADELNRTRNSVKNRIKLLETKNASTKR